MNKDKNKCVNNYHNTDGSIRCLFFIIIADLIATILFGIALISIILNI